MLIFIPPPPPQKNSNFCNLQLDGILQNVELTLLKKIVKELLCLQRETSVLKRGEANDIMYCRFAFIGCLGYLCFMYIQQRESARECVTSFAALIPGAVAKFDSAWKFFAGRKANCAWRIKKSTFHFRNPNNLPNYSINNTMALQRSGIGSHTMCALYNISINKSL